SSPPPKADAELGELEQPDHARRASLIVAVDIDPDSTTCTVHAIVDELEPGLARELGPQQPQAIGSDSERRSNASLTELAAGLNDQRNTQLGIHSPGHIGGDLQQPHEAAAVHLEARHQRRRERERERDWAQLTGM